MQNVCEAGVTDGRVRPGSFAGSTPGQPCAGSQEKASETSYVPRRLKEGGRLKEGVERKRWEVAVCFGGDVGRAGVATASQSRELVNVPRTYQDCYASWKQTFRREVDSDNSHGGRLSPWPLSPQAPPGAANPERSPNAKGLTRGGASSLSSGSRSVWLQANKCAPLCHRSEGQACTVSLLPTAPPQTACS